MPDQIQRLAHTIAEFVDRQRQERVAAGLSPTIVDADALKLIAALLASAPEAVIAHDRNAA